MRFIKPEDRKGQSPVKARKPRREIAKPKYRYITLECEHFTTIETQELYSVWRTPDFPYYCEKCGVPRNGKPAYVPPPQPDKPPF